MNLKMAIFERKTSGVAKPKVAEQKFFPQQVAIMSSIKWAMNHNPVM